MGRNILVLNGSPRMNGNTAALVEQFTKGAEQAGHRVVRYDLQRMQIHPCLGCCQGGKDPQSPCVQKDDMLKIYPDYREADLVVLASPLYYWTVNADYENPKKESVLLMAAEGSGFEESLYWYDRLMDHLGWTDRGKVLCGGVFHAGDIRGNSKLEDAYQLGLRI